MIKMINIYLIVSICVLVASGQAVRAAPPSGLSMSEMPMGALRSQLDSMPEHLRDQALGRILRLEIPVEDFKSLRVHPRGQPLFVCDFNKPEFRLSGSQGPDASVPVSLSAATVSFTGPVSVASPPAWHSRPGSTNVLFLDFNGAVVSNTAWNSYPGYGMVPVWDCRPYSIDSNETTFSIVEQQAMRTIWERVAEDYAPFDIDVTTEEPLSWNRHTGHVLITPDMDKNGMACPHEGAGGVAFVDVFGQADYSYDYAGECYSPAWVFNYEVANGPEYEAEAASHEMGHNLALSHDGTKKETYYGGHEGGSISWGPIMGTGYNRNVSQWSKGDYRLSNNPQDDLAIIAARVGHVPDDFGDDSASAAPLAVDPAGVVLQLGLVEQTLDTDVFTFSAVSGLVDIAISPYRDTVSTTWGGNLDAVLELYDGLGALIATNNPELETSASLATVVSAGTYYLHIHSTGVGDPIAFPSTSGYVRYGSLGQYAITGRIAIDPDLDGDGLPNIWEDTYFGGATNAVASMDVDGDGADNFSEYITGYDPTNASSVYLVTSSIAKTAGNHVVIFDWEPITGRVYSISWAENLTNVFINISGDLPYPSSSYTDSVQRIGPQQFYRINARLEQ